MRHRRTSSVFVPYVILATVVLEAQRERLLTPAPATESCPVAFSEKTEQGDESDANAIPPATVAQSAGETSLGDTRPVKTHDVSPTYPWFARQ